MIRWPPFDGRILCAHGDRISLRPRALPLNVKRQWREWSGFFASSAYAASHDIEYNAIRNAAALIDVSPLFKYRVSGPDAVRLVDRVITRDATKIKVGQVVYSPWCDEHGKVVDDGTIARLDETTFRWTAADPQLRWLRLNSRGLDVSIDDIGDSVAALALQGPSHGTCWRRSPATHSATCATTGAVAPGSAAPRSTSAARATPATSATNCGSMPRKRARSGTRS